MPTISLCMIVKNEEQFLEQCLNSVKDWVDEIIIVDTGSTDHTKEIAAKFTDRLYDFEWSDDFSAARNESLKHATGDWILVLDADETIAETDIQKIKELVKSTPADGYLLIQRNYFRSEQDLQYGQKFTGISVKATSQDEAGFVSSANDSYSESRNTIGWISTPIVRLFRNVPQVRFSGVVHEDVAPSLTGSIINSNLPLHHFGKLNLSVWKSKSQLYEKLAERKVETEPDYYAYYELGRQYFANQKIALAKEMFLKSISLNDAFWVNWFNLGAIQLLENNLDSAQQCLEKAKTLNPNAVQIYANLGVVYAKQKKFQKAIDIFVLGLNLNPNQPGVFKNMSLCYLEMGDKIRAELAFKKAKEFSKKN